MLRKFFYEEKGLFLQSLHPLAALAFLGTMLVLALAFSHPLYLAGIFLIAGVTVWAAEGLETWEGYLEIGLVMMTLIVLINALMAHDGKTILWHGPFIPVFGRVTISLEAIYYGLAMGVRLLNVISIFCLFNLIAHPDKVINLFSRFAGKSTLVIALAARMFPVMAQRYENIRAVQQIRGVDFSRGTLKEKVQKSSLLINSLILSSLEDSLEIAESMQARAFGSGPRSRYRRHRWQPRDTLCLAGSAVALGAGLAGLLHGFGAYTFYPQMGYLVDGPGTVAVLLIVLSGLLAPAILNWGWHRCTFLRLKI